MLRTALLLVVVLPSVALATTVLPLSRADLAQRSDTIVQIGRAHV